MKVLVTGAKGFIGKNLVAALKNTGLSDCDILQFDIKTDPSLLDEFCSDCDFVFHLAGINRPEKTDEFMEGNFGFTSKLLLALEKHKNNCPIMLSSSSQATLDNPYGQSKKAGENLLFDYGKKNGISVYVYRFPNVFGKWSKPNYNSAVATFCYNIARNLPITVNDPDALLNLVYIDDVIEELIRALDGMPTYVNSSNLSKFCEVPVVYEVRLGKIADLLFSFRNGRGWPALSLPNMSDDFVRKLYATFTSFLPENEFSYLLKMNVDERGSFTEMFRTPDKGQVSVNISRPDIVKGNHWHHTKTEKFCVVSGRGVIRFRSVSNNSNEPVIEYFVSGDKLEVIDIPVGFTHNIENLGDSDMVTIMWANESFNPEKPDTFFEKI